jgi:FkbM family methyltransferase
MKIIENTVRGIPMKFVGYTRSLELCSQMNYETENLDFIDRIQAGETLFDLGACEGRFSIYASKKGIVCYSFEPEKNNFNAFLENIEVNNISEGVKPFKLAIGKENTTAKLKIGQPWAGGHQKVVEQQETRADLRFDFKEEEVINVVGLDQFLQDNGIDVPDYLKIDIDGSEMAFINGAQKTLKDKKLKSIIFELEINDKNFNGIITNLSQNGLSEYQRFQVPNEEHLFNIIFNRVN